MTQIISARESSRAAAIREGEDDVAYTLDAAGRLTSLGPAFEALAGWSPADWIGRPLARLIHPQDASWASAIHRAVYREVGQISTFTARLLTRTGIYVHAQFVATRRIEHGRVRAVAGLIRIPMGPEPNGGPAHANGAAPPIVVDAGIAAIVCTDDHGRIVHFDRAAEHMFRCRAADVAGQPLQILVTPRFREVIEQRLTGLLSPAEAAVSGSTVEAAGLCKDGYEFPLEASLASRKTDTGGFVMVIFRNTTEYRLAHRALRRMNEMREDEARRIARELHDEAGQLLASVHVALAEWAQEAPGTAVDHLQRVVTLLDQIEVRLRELSHELRPTILDDLGLVPALEFLAGRIAKRTGLMIRVEGLAPGRLPSVVETTLYRVAQEALTNVTRHARATSACLRLEREDHAIRCAIRDDGIGFDVPGVLARRGEHGLGLMGIRERVVSLAGTVQIESAPGCGTTLLVTIPLEG
jgi:PAS domain S-box-containing protein